MGQPRGYPSVINKKQKGDTAMSKRKHILQHVIFWGIVGLAVTAEGWMDLLCRAVF